MVIGISIIYNFLTWFENRAKAEMNQDEWDYFKINTNTKSELFYNDRN